MLREALSKQEVIDVIERKGCGKVPLVFHKWWGNGTAEKYGDALKSMEQNFPDDILKTGCKVPGFATSLTGNPNYRYGFKDYPKERTGVGHVVQLVDDWETEAEAFLNNFPRADEPGIFDDVYAVLEQEKKSGQDRYKLALHWFSFFELLSFFRSKENLMMDFYDYMDILKEVCQKQLELLKAWIDRYAALGFNGFFVADDFGHQTGPMMSPDIWRELFYPVYKELCDYLHSKNMHLFLHTCGNVTLLMDDIIAAGVDVLHPIQKGCMDEADIARCYGDKITFMVGFDVQHILPEGTPDDVSKEVAHLYATFHKPEGGMLFAAGNGIMPDCSLENIERFLTEITNLSK